jgi:hypothetical protein
LPKLPNAHKAIIKPEKLQYYLLSPTHLEGKYKAAFFQNLGYDASAWEILENDIKILILSNDAVRQKSSSHGTYYIVKGKVTSPSGNTFNIQTVWIILNGEDIPRFVTAYSGGRK